MGDAAQCVKVAIRCRPPSKKEIENGEAGVVELTEAYGEGAPPGQVIINDPNGLEEPAKFAFDIVFDLTILQSQVYEFVGRPALLKTFEGFNGTIFAYGQTGSGKSWSMSGGQDDNRGIIPRMNEELFEQIGQRTANSSARFLVMCSYFEIYNEIIFDLLNPVQDRSKVGGGLQVKEHPVLGIYVKDLTEIVAEDAQKLVDMVDSGQKSRAVSSTMMNSTSSRSHSVFCVKIHQKDEEDKTKNVFAKMNLVDLAGSERQKGTGASGQTLKEGANINKSLSALGNVINALVESANGKKVFIPYRNSKLTRVLQESLGGNSLCTMLATLSPAACNWEETIGTMRYANRAKSIKVNASKNEEESQISRLKTEVEELKKKLGSGGGGGGVVGLTDKERDAEKAKWAKQVQEMEQMMNKDWGEKAKLSQEHERKMQKVAEEQQRAKQALEEEKTRRFQLLEEKNDPELSFRALIDFITALPKFDSPSPLLTGELPRRWLKIHRSLRQQLEEMKERTTMVLMFKHAFDEDVKLWGEAAEADDINLVSTGLSRCQPKLDKFRKGGERLQQTEGQGKIIVLELAENIHEALAELEQLQQNIAKQVEEVDNAEVATGTLGSRVKADAEALTEIHRMLALVSKQVGEQGDELEKLSGLELGPTGHALVQSSRSCFREAGPEADEVKALCDSLNTLIADPSLAALPSCMPAKPLRDYSASEVMDTPETTEAVLGQVIEWGDLCGGKNKKSASELLGRPPPKFILDVAITVHDATGFPPNLVREWPEARDERVACFTHIAEAITSVLGVTPDFDPTDILRGKEVPKTLRLIQLLAVAAAKRTSRDQKAVKTSRRVGIVRPRELPAMFDAMGLLLHRAKTHADAKLQALAAARKGEQSLEEKINAMDTQLREESLVCVQKEEAVADAERQLEEARAEAKKVDAEAQLQDAAEEQPGSELLELEKQVTMLSSSPQDMPPDDVLGALTQQVEDVRKVMHQDAGEIPSLELKQQEVQTSLSEAEAHASQLEIEVAREQKRCEAEKELLGQSPEEQKMILEAQGQKLRSRAEMLEAQIGQVQVEAEERKINNIRLKQETDELQAQSQDAHLQMQIVQEERDAMREAMENLWHEKSLVDEELNNQMQGYINLTERYTAQQDEVNEIEMLVERRHQQVAAIQKNGFEM